MGVSSGGIGGFVTGLAAGAALAFGYVHFGAELPGWLTLPDRLKANLISTTVEDRLYDLSAPADAQRRALEVYFDNRAKDAAAHDAAAGHPFLSALRRARAKREARQLVTAWGGYDLALAKPSLRQALERKHGSGDDHALKAAMLAEALAKRPFLSAWLRADPAHDAARPVLERLREIAAGRQAGPAR